MIIYCSWLVLRSSFRPGQENLAKSIDQRALCRRLHWAPPNPRRPSEGQLMGAGQCLNGREKNSAEEKSKVLDFSSPEFFSRIFSLPPPTAPGSPRMPPSIAGNWSRYNLRDIVTTLDVWRIPKFIICAEQALILKCKHIFIAKQSSIQARRVHSGSFDECTSQRSTGKCLLLLFLKFGHITRLDY